MTALEHLRHRARQVAGWVVLALAAMQLGPVVAPDAFALVCSGSGMGAKLVPTSGSGSDAGPDSEGESTKGGHCALCTPAFALHRAMQSLSVSFDGSAAPRRDVAAAAHAAPSATPPPARGPPLI